MSSASRERRLLAWLLVAALIVTLVKLVAAASLPLFGDEAFYWQCSRRLHIAYVDHPFMTAWLVRGGTALLGHSPLGVRLLFLVAGGAVLPAVYLLARPLVARRDALLTVGLALVLPGLAFMGALSVPDAPLLLLTAAGLAVFERALRTSALRWWLLGGVVGALGLCTHYRHGLFLASVGVVLLVTARGRASLATRGPWLMALLAAMGLLPVLIFNLELDWQPLLYQLAERHGQADGPLAHVSQQLVLMTPLLYLVLLGTLVGLLGRARRGDGTAAVFATLAVVPLGFWLVASAFSDGAHADAHWPLPAYLPLLPFVPGTLRTLAARGRAGRLLAWGAPGLAAVLTIAGALMATGWVDGTTRWRAFVGWPELREELDARLAAWDGPPPVVVVDNYVAAAHAEFALADTVATAPPVFVLDHEQNRKHGRGTQYALWERDERALCAWAGRPALVVVEISLTSVSDRPAWMAHVESLLDIALVGERKVQLGDQRPRKFRFFEGQVREDARATPPGS